MNTYMKAAVLHAPGDLRMEQVPVPSVKADYVLMKVKAAGICGSDIDRVMKTGTYHFPTIPGHEFCGEIARTGTGVLNWKPGDRAVAAPIMPCYSCSSCQEGNYGQCDHYNYLGSRTDGGFAEYVAVPESNLIRLPDSISYLEGAAIEPAAVTLHGIMRLRFRPGDTAVVLGCGAIGLFAIQMAKIMGASHVIAVDIDEQKLEFARNAGADTRINAVSSKVVPEIKTLTNHQGADIVIETAGTSITQVQSIEICRKHGQVLYLGTAHKDVVIPPHVFEHIVRNEITLTGSWNSYSAPFPGREWTGVIGFLEEKRLDIKSFLTHQYPLDEAPKVIRAMAARSFMFNKIVLVLDNE